MENFDFLDAAGLGKNMFTGQPLSDEYKELSKKWSTLPMYSDKNKMKEIVESLKSNQVTIISSGTGSGKTVIMPKLCAKLALESGNLKIAVTNPKVPTTISNAEWSAEIADVTLGNHIGYLTKDDKKTSHLTRIEYLTDGFLKSLGLSDPVFSQYAYLCLDEVHERPVNVDLLLLQIRNALKKRKDLKLVLMSATINKSLFYDYFNNVGLSTKFIEVSGKPNFPIKQVFMKAITDSNGAVKDYPDNYLQEAVLVIDNILKEATGNILVFVPTAKDCLDGCKLLKSTSNCHKLFGKASKEMQNAAIAESENGEIKVIFATNIAESSITFPGLDYVIDTGKNLDVRYNAAKHTRVSSKNWISKAEVSQRIGRVGRVREGTAFHLYSQNFHEKAIDPDTKQLYFPNMPDPKIHRDNPIDDLFSIGISQQRNDTLTPAERSWTGALENVMQLISPPTPDQISITQQYLEFYKAIGKVQEKDKSIWRIGNIGYTLHDIKMGFQLNLDNAILMLAGMLYDAVDPVSKIIAISEETGGDLSQLWKLDKEGNPISKMNDPNVVDGRSEHFALVNLFDNMMSLDLDMKKVPGIKEKYDRYIRKSQRFSNNHQEEIIRNWPWCLGNRTLTSMKDKFAVAILIGRLFNACTMGKKTAKSLYVKGLSAEVKLTNIKENDLIVCDSFSMQDKTTNATISTAFSANMKLECN